jgi:hypothetical protein
VATRVAWRRAARLPARRRTTARSAGRAELPYRIGPQRRDCSPIPNLPTPSLDARSFYHVERLAQSFPSFIDRVHLRDEGEILSGSIKPTHVMAVMRRDRSIQPRVWKHLTPYFCVRGP